ncbi:MAG: GvpL/GvpF family gas vesicle protein [Chloroflexi bacterium]|nr:GvpL/GvpF family gas vesicle protein [Chloroflexota bacterium]
MPKTEQPQISAQEAGGGGAGCYVYCVVAAQEAARLEEVGVEGRPLLLLSQGGLGALAHRCPSAPYQAADRQRAADLVLAHHRVVEWAWRRWGNALPLAFNTIVAGGESRAEDDLRAWLEAERPRLAAKLKALAGKGEYSLQLFWDAAFKAHQAASSPELRGLETGQQAQTPGLAYLGRQRLEARLRRELEAQAEAVARHFHRQMAGLAEGLRVESAKPAGEGRQMLLNLSCLLSPESLSRLQAEAEGWSQREGYFVRLAGPWPPYSFC